MPVGFVDDVTASTSRDDDVPGPSGPSGPATTPASGHLHHYKKHHRRTSSLWVPPSRPTLEVAGDAMRTHVESSQKVIRKLLPGKKTEPEAPLRKVIPNSTWSGPRYLHQNRSYKNNKISTTKYSVLTFIPKNLFEQLHRLANLYFIFIVVLNLVIEAYGRYVSIFPISFVMAITAIKDAVEDYRRYMSDRKMNHRKCRVWDPVEKRYRKLEWQNVVVGDFVHLAHDEIIPADVLFLRSSDPSGVCYVETSNLDGESNLKQRQAVRAMDRWHALKPTDDEFEPKEFKYHVMCEEPSTDVYRFEGRLEAAEEGETISPEMAALRKENVLLRGCVIKNTDFVEGIVMYAGHDTKAMLNNSGPRYKRSSLEKAVNWDIIWCCFLLLLLCSIGAIFCTVYLRRYTNHLEIPFIVVGEVSENINTQGFRTFWDYIIVLQVLIPISLYVSVEFVKIGQIYFISNDQRMYYAPADKRIQCRALNITEELGQISYVMSDKTGTLTENQMVFRRCAIAGRDYGASGRTSENQETVTEGSGRPKPTVDHELREELEASTKLCDIDDPVYGLFLNMAICNTVVVTAKPHEDLLDDFGDRIAGRDVTTLAETPTVLRESMRKTLDSPTTTAPLDSPTTSAETDFVEIDLIGFESDKRSSTSSKDFKKEEEKKPEEGQEGKDVVRRRSIVSGLVPNRPSILGLNLAKLRELKPFKRHSTKRIEEEPEQPAPSYYDAESPDELALVEAAGEYGVRLLRRHFDEVLVHLKHKNISMRYKVLHTLPFDSDRKRMSVVVRESTEGADDRVFVLTKGADASIMPLIDLRWAETELGAERVASAEKQLTEYAKEGLRTLVLACKQLDEIDYEKWRVQHVEAELDPHHRENLIRESALRIEKDFVLTGVTAIEDRLQDGVPETIASLRAAGLRVWVLTGDKVETAVNIAYSSKLFSPGMDLVNIGTATQTATADVVSELLDEHLDRVARAKNVTDEARFGLVLNGACFDACVEGANKDKFVRLLQGSHSVLCCRATPLQKAALVRLAKEGLKGRVLAIGDGANDVSMIQNADVGVGLSGQEGMQAVMASDFALARFRFLAPLLLVHGHWCYNRLAKTILYFFYKNATMVFVIFWYQIFCAFSAQIAMDAIYLMFFNLLFTSLPPLVYGILEQDAPAKVLLENPILYDQGRMAKNYRWYSYWLNMIDAIYQSAVMFFIAYLTFMNSTTTIWQFGYVNFAVMIVVNSLHLAITVQCWNMAMALSLIISVVGFFVFAMVYSATATPSMNLDDAPYMIAEAAWCDPKFWSCLLLSVVICALPRFLWTVTRNTLKTSRTIRARRVMKRAKKAAGVSKQSNWRCWPVKRVHAKEDPIPQGPRINPPPV